MQELRKVLVLPTGPTHSFPLNIVTARFSRLHTTRKKHNGCFKAVCIEPRSSFRTGLENIILKTLLANKVIGMKIMIWSPPGSPPSPQMPMQGVGLLVGPPSKD